MSRYELAQLNIGVMKGPLDSSVMADFVANLEPINALADAAPGFVWRLKSEEGNATEFRPMGDEIIVNMSVWRDLEALNHFVYKSDHVAIMRRRKEFFERMKEAFMVLWWVRKGHRPTVEEAIERLEILRKAGSTPEAFTFRDPYPSPDSERGIAPFGDECPA
ncbi:MAG TPA: DUF3291 domain-containing protein [Steroidobacteraceae bacterium]|jgi:hypothetical protein